MTTFTLCRTASAQVVSFGATGGIPLTDTTSPHDESRPYVIGPSVEFRLPARFALEIDALYQRVGNTTTFGVPSGTNLTIVNLLTPFAFINRERGNSWEFPLLGKYYFRPRTSAWQPFLSTGYAFRTVGLHTAGTETTINTAGALQTNSFHSDFRSNLGIGAVFAAGARFNAGRFAVLPEIRYTRWGGSDEFLRKNETRLLLGIRF